jgi:hypothetical protein
LVPPEIALESNRRNPGHDLIDSLIGTLESHESTQLFARHRISNPVSGPYET